MTGVSAAAAAIAARPVVRSTVALRFGDAIVEAAGARPVRALLQGVDESGAAGARPWTLLRGRDHGGPQDAVVNQHLADQLHLEPGSRIVVRPSCEDDQVLPPVSFTISGIGDFPFDSVARSTVALTMAAMDQACGASDHDQADLILVAVNESVALRAAAADVAAAVPHLIVLTNDELVGRLERGGFSYFRQISTVLTTVTFAFAALLISVMLTVSVNQRLGEIAALRALGFTRWRVAADVICESGLIVLIGGALSLPLGLALARWLDAILKAIPGLPADAQFFVFQPQALQLHAAMMVGTAVLAALYPVHIVARLPIAATLRDEVIG
jgi:putative ABC transport system permease protein